MKIQSYIVLFFLIATGLFLYKIKTHTKSKDNAVLIVGTSPDYPPYAFYDKNKNIVGFDIDIAHEVAQFLNKKIMLKDIPFTSLIFELFSGDIDIIASGITPTERKAKKVAFSKTYFDDDPLVALTNNSIPAITSLEQLHHKTIVVNIGYTADLYLSSLPDLNLVRLETPAECFMALASSSANVFVAAKSSLVTYLKKHPHHNFTMHTLPNTGDSYALVLNKHNHLLLAEINRALTSMKKNGTIEKLKQKWNL